jgi:hypothetical protein
MARACDDCKRKVYYLRRVVRIWTVWDHWGVMDALLWHDRWSAL